MKLNSVDPRTDEQADLMLCLFKGRMTRSEFVRRALLLGVSASTVRAALDWLQGSTAGAAGDRVLNVTSYGGSYNDAIQKSWLEPFAKGTGIRVNLGSGASLALLQAQISSGTHQWDIVDLSDAEYVIATQRGLIVPYDFSVVDTSNTAKYAISSTGVEYAAYLTTIGWDRRKIPTGLAPKTWAEFWDVNRYRTKRALRGLPSVLIILEIALLADGVPVDKVFPIDVPRALKSLDRLGFNNILWYKTNAEPVEFLQSSAVQLAQIFDGRAIIANRQGGSIGFTVNEAISGGDTWGIAKTTDKSREAMQLISFILSNPKANADFMMMTAYATANTKALEQLPASVRDILPTNPKLAGKIVYDDPAWWVQNTERVNKEFLQWQLKH